LKRKTLRVVNPLGFHARAAAKFVAEASRFESHVTVIFKDGRSLMRSLLSAQPDLLGALLRQEVTFEGNLNYVYRLAFLARRLQLSIVKLV